MRPGRRLRDPHTELLGHPKRLHHLHGGGKLRDGRLQLECGLEFVQRNAVALYIARTGADLHCSGLLPRRAPLRRHRDGLHHDCDRAFVR